MKNAAGSRRGHLPNIAGGVRELIISARKAVVRNIDAIQVITNFEIGRRIFFFEQNEKIRADYGEKIIQNLSGRLTAEFGKGFSSTNLKLMRQFYMVYAPKIGQTLSDQFGKFPFTLSWSHYVFLFGIKDEKKNREKQKQVTVTHVTCGDRHGEKSTCQPAGLPGAFGHRLMNVRGAPAFFPDISLVEELGGGRVECWGNREICLKNPKQSNSKNPPLR